MRDVTGAEALGIQGFPPSALWHGDNFLKSPDLLHLAGNAMSGFVLTALFIALFTVGDFNSVDNFVARAEALDSQDICDEDADGDEMSGEVYEDNPDASSSLGGLSDSD